MSIVSGNFIRTSCRFKNSESGDVVNVYHFYAGGTGLATDNDIMTAIEAQMSVMYAYVASQMPSSQDPYDIRHDVVDWVGGKETVIRTLGTRTWTLTTPPNGSTDMMPAMDGVIVNLRTTEPKTFGRKYVGALLEGGQSSGNLTGAALAQFVSYAAAILTPIVSGTITLTPGVLSYKAGNNIPYWASFVAAVVNSILGSQRRRRKNRGS